MHPIERLRYVARSHGGDQRLLVRETASALRGLGVDPAGLVVACRRIVERHPTSGPLWWLCSSVLASAEPFRTAAKLADDIEGDATPDALVGALAEDSTVTVLGWPDLVGEALLRRGDVTVLVVDVDGEAPSFVRRLERSDVAAALVEPAGVAGAVAVSDLVLVEALAATTEEVLAVRGSRAAASVAWCSEVPVWLVAGRGRCLPQQTFTVLLERLGESADAWDAGAEPVPLALARCLVTPTGVHEVDAAASALRPEAPAAPELFRASPM